MNTNTVHEVLSPFAARAQKIFEHYDEAVIIRRKTVIANIDARYISQFTLQHLSRTRGGLRGSADVLGESLGFNQTHAYAASSISEARKKFPAELFLELNQAIISQIDHHGPLPYLKGRRLMAIDGSKVSLPSALLRSGFQVENPRSHYPVGLVSSLYNVSTKLFHDVSMNAHMDERKAAAAHFQYLSPNDIVVYDRGYFSFKLLMKHRQMGSDAVFRVHEALGIKELTDFISKNAQVPFADKIVRIEPKSPALIKKLATSFPDLAQDCPVRLIKYTYKSKVFYLLTTLTDTLAFPSSIFPDMYHGRWSIEEGYKQIKAHILVNEFHGKCPRTIRQEIFAAVVLINFSRILTMAAETETNSDARSDKKKTIQKKTQRHGNPTNPMPTFSAYN